MDYQRDMERLIQQLSFGTDYIFDKIYPFPTENVKDCLSNYDFKDKNCVSVLGSSFQMIDMYLRGAKSVTTFDINPFSIYYFYLVKAFIKSGLEVEDYVELFQSENVKYIEKTYNRISSKLYGVPKMFWDDLFECSNKLLFLNHELFHKINFYDDDVYNNSLFFETENLKYLKNHTSMLEPHFINCDIISLDRYLKDKYDMIYLSNIMQYVSNIYNSNEVESLKKYKTLINKLSLKLKDDGEIYCAYLYKYYYEYFCNKNELKNVFDEDNYCYLSFPGYTLDKENSDEVLIYKK